MSYFPPKPTGKSRFAAFVRAVWDILWGAESIFVNTEGGPLRFQKLASGKYQPILKQVGGGGGATLLMFVLIEVFDDYLRCAPLTVDQDGVFTFISDDATDVYIAKPPELRHSIASETIDGELVTYEYTDESTRIATYAVGPVVETQVVTPHHLIVDDDNAGSIIYGLEVKGGTGVWRTTTPDDPETEEDETVKEQIKLLEISGREWGWVE